MLMKHRDPCQFNLFWHTSAACSRAAGAAGGGVDNGCLVVVPGFNQKLDLKALSEKSFFKAESG
jgi:hypothetical protein